MLGFRRNRNNRRPLSQRPISQPGTYVGAAVFKPKHVRDLRDDLRPVVGQVVELQFVTVADERCAGQNIYMERPGTRSVLRGAWVVDKDVEFIESAGVRPAGAPIGAPGRCTRRRSCCWWTTAWIPASYTASCCRTPDFR